MANPAYETFKKESELIAELSRIVELQIYGEMDWVRTRAYWKARLPELLEHSDELAEALTDALSNAAIKGSPYDWKRKS